MLKMKEQMKKVDIDSDEDDLAGWHKKWVESTEQAK